MEISIRSIVYAGAMLLAASCSTKDETDSGNPDTSVETEDSYHVTSGQFTASEMKLGKLAIHEFHDKIKARGMFDVPPENQASVSTYFGGTVKDIRLLPGEKVKKGQQLFVLENPEYVQIQQDYLEAKNQLGYLKSDFERQKNLAQDNVTSQKNFLKAESDYQVISVKVASLARKLELMNINPETLTVTNVQSTIRINAPITGYITKVNITKGTYLAPPMTAITIVDTDHLHLELNVFEKDLPDIKIDQPIVFSVQDNPSKKYNALVHLINKTVDPETRMIGLHGHLTDESHTEYFNPGMYVEAEIYTHSNLKLALPEDAVVEIAGKQYALVLIESNSEGFRLVKKEITTGITTDGFIEILNADKFKDSDQFLIRGAFNLITE